MEPVLSDLAVPLGHSWANGGDGTEPSPFPILSLTDISQKTANAYTGVKWRQKGNWISVFLRWTVYIVLIYNTEKPNSFFTTIANVHSPITRFQNPASSYKEGWYKYQEESETPHLPRSEPLCYQTLDIHPSLSQMCGTRLTGNSCTWLCTYVCLNSIVAFLNHYNSILISTVVLRGMVRSH